MSWAEAFALTVLIEVPLVLAVLRGPLPAGPAVAIALTAQCWTHPTLWFVVPQFQPYLLWVLCAETGVVTAEALWFGLWLRRSGDAAAWRRGLAASLLANTVSTLIGLALQG